MRALVALVAATTLAAGCGQSGANPTPTPTPADAAPNSAVPTAAVPSAAAPATTPASAPGDPDFVDDCQPCRISISDHAGTYAFSFVVASEGDGRVVKSIQVVPPGASAPPATLPVKSMMPVLPGAKFFFGGLDLNFDGQRDLVLMTRQGTVNAYALYWVFDTGRRAFMRLGEYPVFTVDTATRRLRTYERGGPGNTISEATEYAFEDGGLTVVRVETHEPIKDSPLFLRTVQERRGSDLVVTLKENVKNPR